MDEKNIRLVIGALLHDIGKVVYRSGADSRRHALGGTDYLHSERIGLVDKEILDCVHYHHAADLRQAKLAKDSLAYIVYMADNIASAADRREQDDSVSGGFDKAKAMDSIFNLLNGNNQHKAYSPRQTNVEEAINYPADTPPAFSAGEYDIILRNITENLHGLEWNEQYLHSLMDSLEANLSFVPSSTNKQEVADISLYDHMKLTAAFASAILAYLEEQGEKDYHKRLYTDGQAFYREQAFILTKIDLSGIQKFIYTITSKRALKTLRARSFYLDFLVEHIADELLARLGLTRANLLYSGGGGASFLLPNTKDVKACIRDFQKEINNWCQQYFDIALYLAVGYAPCSSENLQDSPAGSYAGLYRQISQALSDNKAARYTPADILQLNNQSMEDDSRECKVCRHAGAVNTDGICSFCAAMQGLSENIMSERYKFFAVLPQEAYHGLPLPGGCVLAAGDEKTVRQWQEQGVLRIYGKNRFYTGKAVTNRLWIGDYHTGETFAELAEQATGIPRLGVLRADIDNLGQAFAMGFQRPDGSRKYVTLSRTAELSRQLSLFFKLHIRKLLEKPEYTLSGRQKDCRHAAIVYSGGDDLFIVGAWDDVIELAVDIRRSFARYADDTLTLSAGIGVYPASYPISVMAAETAELEEKSKGLPGKSAITLFEDGAIHEMTDDNGNIFTLSDGTYSWKELEECVLAEKYRCIDEFFSVSSERGKNFLYKILELLRNRKEKINLARYVYLLSRMEPDKKTEDGEALKRYRAFAAKMMQWIQNDRDTRQLKTAIQIYAYITRETGAEHETVK